MLVWSPNIRLYYILVAVLLTTSAHAQEGDFPGITSEGDIYGHARLGNDFYDLDKDSLQGERCKGRVLGDSQDNFRFALSEKSAGKLKQVAKSIFDPNTAETKNGKLQISKVNTFWTSKRDKFVFYPYKIERLQYRGVDAARLTIDGFAKEPLIFTFAKEPRFRFSFASWTRCPMLSWFPELVYFLTTPSSENEIASWVERNKTLLSDPAAYRPEPNNFAASNEFYIGVEIGNEIAVIESLMKESWVLDASMRSFPYGPPFTVLNLHKPIFTERTKLADDSDAKVRKKIAELFPKMAVDSIAVIRETGASKLTVELEGRVIDVLPKLRKFSGHWLKAKIDLAIYAAGFKSDEYVETMIISVSDGYLAKWPDSDSRTPEQSHVTQFHLKEDGGDEFGDFTILIKLQEHLTAGLSKSLDAEIAE